MDETRTPFREAAEAFADTVRGLPHHSWEQPALDVWSVRDLVGHTSRALSTVEAYLARPAEQVQLPDARAYYAACEDRIDPRSIAQRGREAGAALGDDAGARVTELAARVTRLVADAPAGATVSTVVGGMRLEDYLITRIVELTVHTLDILVATEQEPQFPENPLRLTLHLTAELALLHGDGAELTLALTGRRRLRRGFTVL